MSVLPNWFVAFDASHLVDLPLSPAPSGMRTFVPEDRHFTVAFLGPVSEVRAHAAFEASATECAALSLAEPLRVELAPLVPLGRPGRYSALSATVGKGRQAVEGAIGALRVPAYGAAQVREDRRKPLAHMTVARPKRSASDLQRQAGLAWARDQEVAGFPVVLTHLALYTWSEQRKERMFRILTRAPISAVQPLVSGARPPIASP